MYNEDEVLNEYLNGRVDFHTFLDQICEVSDYYINIWDTIDRMEGYLMSDFTRDRWREPIEVDLNYDLQQF